MDLLVVAIIIMATNFLNADLSAWKQLSLADLWPVIAITVVSFLIKTGVLSALVIGLKKLWEWLTR